MKREKINDTVLRVAEKITRNEAEKICSKWPPDCTGFFHQPKRPKDEKGGIENVNDKMF